MNKTTDPFKFSIDVILYPLLLVLLIWLVFSIEIRFGYRFNKYGIYPQTVKGLRGVVFSPFIHSGIKHLYSNTIPLFVLSSALFYFYKEVALKVIIYGIIISGLITWAIGRPSYHIGISGLIYVLFSFNFFKGIFTRHYRLIALSLLVIFLYGSMFVYAFPIDEKISWEGHTAGLITGFIFALIFKKKIAKVTKYQWEQEHYNPENDEFMQHFDVNGNFVPSVKEDVVEESIEPAEQSVTQDSPKIRYVFKANKDIDNAL